MPLLPISPITTPSTTHHRPHHRPHPSFQLFRLGRVLTSIPSSTSTVVSKEDEDSMDSTPSAPTASIASAIIVPMSSSLPAEMEATAASRRGAEISVYKACVFFFWLFHYFIILFFSIFFNFFIVVFFQCFVRFFVYCFFLFNCVFVLLFSSCNVDMNVCVPPKTAHFLVPSPTRDSPHNSSPLIYKYLLTSHTAHLPHLCMSSPLISTHSPFTSE